MDSSSLKGLEFLVIVGAVAWFYVAQQRNLKRLKEEREAKEKATAATEAKVTSDDTSSQGRSTSNPPM
jgi:hypothetical protein